MTVTALAEFACRVGDLSPGAVIGPSAREGIREHQKIQRAAVEEGEQADDCVLAEVRLSNRFRIGGREIRLGGRVDLLQVSVPLLCEIKTTLVPADNVPESQKSLQWAQLYLYGFLYLSEESGSNAHLNDLELELIHVNMRAQTQERERRRVTRLELETHAYAALELYVSWLLRIADWGARLADSAGPMTFPHAEFRAGQRDMAAAIYRSARDAEAFMCEAPTGIGKTLSALFPAIKLLGEGGIEQVIYLTAKVAGRLSALQALKQMQQSGLVLTAVQIRAKQSSCFCSIGRCEQDDTGRCPMTLGFFDRLPAARDELLQCGIMTDALLDEIAWQHQLCPFELALQMLPWVQVVIADYNYVFDPLVRLAYFAEPRKDAVLLIDEAHNLVDRSRSMFSAKLSRTECMTQAALCKAQHPAVSKALDKLARALVKCGSDLQTPNCVKDTVDGSVSRAAAQVIEAISATFGLSPVLPESSGEIFRTLCRFVVISDLFGENHRCVIDQSQAGRRKEISLTLYCLDASTALLKQYRLFRTPIVFSATLRPGTFYRDALGLPDSTKHLQLVSPFDPDRVCHCIVDWVDTRYRKRESSMSALVDLIHQACALRPGNYLVFFPSYAYLNQACNTYRSLHPQEEVWQQSPEQTREQHQETITRLEQPGHRIGFAILGGVFGEGIDYAGERLVGVIVVSAGLPGLDPQNQLMSEHYQARGHDGYDFAYRYPGFTRVLQTVGRLIRNESDSGVVLLVDDRFKQGFYQGLFPDHWHLRRPASPEKIVQELQQFWNSLPAGS
ncbi:MAG: hypothetical protein HKN42_16495 [Granulosicoccus sp.]|nr:hypothetical protein [Granulosicoccus sp.]